MLYMTASTQSQLLFESTDASDTEGLARCFARDCPHAAVVHLSGELGSGKSTFARALLRGLGVTGPIKSPTYTLLETYALADGLEAVHMDLYRIAVPDELDYLALDAFTGSLRIMLVEWPEKGDGYIPVADVRIEFAHQDSSRRIRLFACSEKGRNWLNGVRQAEPKP